MVTKDQLMAISREIDAVLEKVANDPAVAGDAAAQTTATDGRLGIDSVELDRWIYEEVLPQQIPYLLANMVARQASLQTGLEVAMASGISTGFSLGVLAERRYPAMGEEDR